MRQEATQCYICLNKFTEDDQKFVDHNHFTGEVRGIAHNVCNLHYHLQQSKIPVIFHNLKSYDGHFMIKNISEFNAQNNLDIKISCIANNSQKLMSITWGKIRFIDSNQFMSASLETLARNLGGISTSGNIRYASANNKYCANFDKEKDTSFLLYVDANNLYGESLMQKLPYRKFKFVEKIENYGETFAKNYSNGIKGYIYDFDLKYPENLHKKHNVYPLAPEQLTISYDMISKYNKDIMENLKSKEDIKIVMGNTKKLTPTLLDKKNYVCNIRNLQLYLLQGLKIEKINRIIEFDQKDFMRPYIELNTNLRQQAKNDFEKDFFKLMNNSVFGKTCENVRKRANYELVSSEKRMTKVVSSRYFKNFIKISENLALVEKHQKIVKLNKPTYIGMQVLDLSKITMQNYYYNHILQQNFEKVDLIMTDTDSLFLFITTQKGQDLYNNMIQNADKYDFSNVTKGDLFDKIKQHCDEKQLDLKTFLNQNKAVVGKFKNEVPNSHIVEAVSVKAKCYDFLTSDDNCHKKLKGIKKCVLKSDITHDDYKECIFSQKVKMVEQKTLRSYNHEIYTISQEKLALQSYNDKRYILQDGIRSLAYGHHSIKNFS